MHSLLSKCAQHDLGCRRAIKHHSFIHSPLGVNMAGNKLSGLPFPSTFDETASKEYADRVGVYAREHADRVRTNGREYVDRSTERLGSRFHDLTLAFFKR